jgi:hypothetical protein
MISDGWSAATERANHPDQSVLAMARWCLPAGREFGL